MSQEKQKGTSDIPTGWKVSRYRSLSKSSSSTDNSNGTKRTKKSAPKHNREKSNSKRTNYEPEVERAPFENSAPIIQDFTHLEKEVTQTSTPIKPRASSVVSSIPSDSVIRDRHVSPFKGAVVLPEIVIPEQITTEHDESPAKSFREPSSMNCESPDLKSLEHQTDGPESEYEKFRKSFRRSSHVTKPNLSLDKDLSVATMPTISGLNLNGTLNDADKNQKVSSAHNASKKMEKPEQSTAGGKIDEKGSTVVIYKSVQGERLILADDQRRNESDYETARDTSGGSVMVIDDLRRFKTPIMTPTVPGRKASPSPLEAGKSRGKLRPSTGSGGSNEGNARFGKKKCEQRKWRDILQNHQSPYSKKQQQMSGKPPLPLSGATTNDRITTINYEILDTRSRRSTGALKRVDAEDSSRKPIPVRPTTSNASGGKDNPRIDCNYDPKSYVLNFKIKVPGSTKLKEQVINGSKK